MTDSGTPTATAGADHTGPTPEQTSSRPVAAAGRVARRLRALWNALVGAIGVLVGLAPHVLHHIGLLAGTALVAGTGGTALFGAVGLIASIPLLLRLKRRFKTWWAPAIGLAVFAVMFALSAFVIGPAISGTTDSPAPDQPATTVDHGSHHG